MWRYSDRQPEEQPQGTVREAARTAPSTPHTQRETLPRSSQRTTQLMEWTPTPTKGDGTTGKTPPRHSQENTQPAPPQLTELYARYREKHSREATQPTATSVNNPPPTITTESLAQYQLAGESQTCHITDASQLSHPISRAVDVDNDSSPSYSTPQHPRHCCHYSTTHRRQMPQMGSSCPDPSQSSTRKCAACTMCGQRFAPGKQRLQQWAN